jgi:hypothetical protein
VLSVTSRNVSEGSEPRDRIIRASEVGQYVYCAHAWWLARVENLPSAHLEAMEAGRRIHCHHGRGVRTSLTLRWLGYALLTCAVVLVILVISR